MTASECKCRDECAPKMFEAVYRLRRDGREVGRTRVLATTYGHARLVAMRQMGNLLWRADVEVTEVDA